MKALALAKVLAASALVGCSPEPATMVANPEVNCWENPSFRGRPFWPVFRKTLHQTNAPADRPSAPSSWGLEDLPLTKEYASLLSPSGFRAGAAKYLVLNRWNNPKKFDEKGRKVFCELIPESERLSGTYTLRDLFGPGLGDFMYEGDWKTHCLWNPQLGNPYFLNVPESRPPYLLDGLDRGDKADFKKWLDEHPGFVGFLGMGEIDSETGNYHRAMTGSGEYAKIDEEIRKDLASRFKVWKNRDEFVDCIRSCWECENAFLFNTGKLWPVYCNNHTLAHIIASVGATGIANEISSSQGSPWTWSGAYSRGASRQWGIPFAWYCATFYRGFRRNQPPGSEPVAGDNKWPRDGKFTAKRPPYMGASLSLTARQKYYGWLIGASFIEDEPWAMLSSSSENGKPAPSPYAKVFNDVFVRSRRIDRGAPVTPIALLTPIAESVTRGGYVSGLDDKDGYPIDLLNLPAYYFTLQPVHEDSGKYPMLQDRRRHGDEGCLFNSPFGEIWDVLVADGGQPSDKFASVLSHYPAAFLIGTYRRGEVDVAALESYVRAGGTLFLSADYVETGVVPASLAGVSFGAGRSMSGERLFDEKGADVAQLGGYELHEASPAPGTAVFLKDEKGATVAFARSLGKGRVITTACTRSMPAMYWKKKYRFLDETYKDLRQKIISDNGNLGLIRYLLDRVQRETIPVSVEGDIQWGLGRNGMGWLLWFINNKGIAKFVGEPDEVDASKKAVVKVSLGRLAGMTPRNADTGGALPVEGGAFSVEVGPGDVAFVHIGKWPEK